MFTTTILYMHYNIKQQFFIVPLSQNDKEVQEIEKFLNLIENSGALDLLEEQLKLDKNTYFNNGGRPSFNPYNMLAVIIFSFAFSFPTLREIEGNCKYDLRYIYIIENDQPTYKTIGNFINKIINPIKDELFSLITNEIIKECGLDLNTVFIDGSKFEANCNKYNFVWKPNTYHRNLTIKVKEILKNYNINCETETSQITSNEMSEAIFKFYKKVKDIDLSLKENKVHKVAYKTLIESFEKVCEYEEKEEVCGANRNSYYKTDKDATAMCLKADYYSGAGSNMHAAYNVQLAVNYGIILTYYVSQSRTDINDFIPTLDKFYKFYKTYPEYVCADSGYGSLNNYRYLDDHGIKNYVKYFTWEGEVSARNPQSYTFIGENKIICLNGNIGEKQEENPYHPRKQNAKFYKITGCNTCGFSSFCKRFQKNKDEDFKYFEVVEELQMYINQSFENLLSVKGIELRVNRSCQVEGSFGILKQNMRYERIRRRTFEKVKLEFMLTFLGLNIRKYFKYIRGGKPFEYWHCPPDLVPELKKKPSAKKLSNKANKKKNKSVNEIAKQSI